MLPAAPIRWVREILSTQRTLAFAHCCSGVSSVIGPSQFRTVSAPPPLSLRSLIFVVVDISYTFPFAKHQRWHCWEWQRSNVWLLFPTTIWSSHREHTKPQVADMNAVGCREASTVCTSLSLYGSTRKSIPSVQTFNRKFPRSGRFKVSGPSAFTSLGSLVEVWTPSPILGLLDHSSIFWRSWWLKCAFGRCYCWEFWVYLIRSGTSWK